MQAILLNSQWVPSCSPAVPRIRLDWSNGLHLGWINGSDILGSVFFVPCWKFRNSVFSRDFYRFEEFINRVWKKILRTFLNSSFSQDQDSYIEFLCDVLKARMYSVDGTLKKKRLSNHSETMLTVRFNPIEFLYCNGIFKAFSSSVNDTYIGLDTCCSWARSNKVDWKCWIKLYFRKNVS